LASLFYQDTINVLRLNLQVVSEKICQETGGQLREKQIGAEILETGSPHFQSQNLQLQLLDEWM